MNILGTTEPQISPYYYDYDRRPPKSSELFDPNAPSNDKSKTTRPFSMGTLDDIRQMQNFPRSPSHDSFFQYSQSQGYHTKVRPDSSQNVTVLKDDVVVEGNGTMHLDHILEIGGISKDSLEFISEIEQSGAIIKWLDNTAIAIYKTAMAAKQALTMFDANSPVSLRPWKLPLLVSTTPTTPSNQIANPSIQ